MISALIEQFYRNATRGSEYPEQGPLFITDGGNPLRLGERLMLGLAATQYAGTSNKADGCTALGDPAGALNVFWPERGATLVSYAPDGAIGGAFGSIKRLRYPAGTKQWRPNTAYIAGDTIGRKGYLYHAQNDGMSGSAPPTHTTGTAMDGTVSWLCDTDAAATFTAAIGSVHLCLQDFDDGEAGWESYAEGGRSPVGGTYLGRESNSFQDGPLVVTYPSDLCPAGAVRNYWSTAGKSLGAPLNPSSDCYAVGEHQQTFATGFIVGKNAIMPGGYAMKLFPRAEHAFGWFNDLKQVVSMLYSIATNNNERVALVLQNRAIRYYAVGGIMASDESAAPAGTPPTDRVARVAYAGLGYAEVRSFNIAGAASDLLLRGSNGGLPRLDGFVSAPGTATVAGYYPVKDHVTGVIQKLAVLA